jgi:hypothetical protein
MSFGPTTTDGMLITTYSVQRKRFLNPPWLWNWKESELDLKEMKSRWTKVRGETCKMKLKARVYEGIGKVILSLRLQSTQE